MRRTIGEVKNKKLKNVRFVKFIDNNTIQITLNNDYVVTLKSEPTDYGYSSHIYVDE